MENEGFEFCFVLLFTSLQCQIFQDELFALMQKAVGEYLTQSITVEPLLVSLEFALDMFESNV